MELQPRVSVITCFLNEEKFLKEAIESVIDQDYTNWELLLVDDGSTDKSTIIAKHYSSNNPKICYYEHMDHSNKGLSASRNLGIFMAKGELVAFLDADDFWEKKKLETQVAVMLQYPEIGMTCEASKYWYSWNGNDDREDAVIQVGLERDKVFEPRKLIHHLYPMSKGDAPCPSAIMVRTATLRKVEGFESQFTGIYQLYEDQAFLFKIYLNDYVHFSSGCNNKYRQREGSLVHEISKGGNYLVVRKYFLKWAQQYLKNNHITDRSIDKLIERELLYCETFLSDSISYRIFIKVKKLLNRLSQ